jgi:hypothetical protein
MVGEDLQREMGRQYATHLTLRLGRLGSADAPDDPTGIPHLLEMCEKIVANSNHWSVTKLHRWIGYIQGVMVQRGFTTVDQERDDYKKIKAEILPVPVQLTHVNANCAWGDGPDVLLTLSFSNGIEKHVDLTRVQARDLAARLQLASAWADQLERTANENQAGSNDGGGRAD